MPRRPDMFRNDRRTGFARYPEFVLIPFLIWVSAASVVSFALYGLDKRAARRGTRRVPESTLLTVDFLFGYPGGLLAQRVFRHKTRKTSYRVRFWLLVALHVTGYGVFLYFRLR